MADSEQMLQKTLLKIAAEHKYADQNIKVKAISTDGANFTTKLFSATISDENKPKLHLFAKVATIGEAMRSQLPMKLYDVERIFYTELLKVYQQIEESHGVPQHHRLSVSKFYACNPDKFEETIVLEDLTRRGYLCQDRFMSVDWENAASAVSELAKLHALSFALKRENLHFFVRMTEEFQFMWTPKNEGLMEQIIVTGIESAMKVTKKGNREKLAAFMEKHMKMSEFLKIYEQGTWPVLRHGDYRPSNLMHKVREDGSVHMIPVDYQTMVAGSPVLDLLYFIFLGTYKKFRDQHYHRLIDHYQRQLADAICRLGLNPDKEYSKEDFYEDLKENMILALSFVITYLPMVTVESSAAPTVNENLDITSFHGLKPSAVYVERLNGIIDDYIEWGLL